ncbi:MAG: glycosyltransferase [Stagnimonas sp.]|nr:glycosyltransferase [Stagnimonas sp.]
MATQPEDLKVDAPAVSIIIPTFNVQAYIEETLQSVLTQTFVDFELIVIDDGSTDQTVDKVEQLALRDSRIRLMSNHRRKGVSGARNTGIGAATGQWICFLDGDDLLHESALAERIKVSRQHPDCCFFSGDYIRFWTGESKQGSSQSEENAYWRQMLRAGRTDPDKPVVLDEPVNLFMQAVLTWTGCVMISADLVKSLSGFNETLVTAEDDHLWMRVAARCRQMVFVPTSLTFYRQRPGSLTQSGNAIHEHAVAAYLNLMKDPGCSVHSEALMSNIRSFIHQNTYHYRKTGVRAKALYWAMQGLRYDSANATAWRNLAATLLLN